MLFLFELKKVFIKQYAVIIIFLVVLARLVTSPELYKTSYSDLSPVQQEYYLQYIEQYGGRIDDKKAEEITALYNEVISARRMMDTVNTKNLNGEYKDISEYFEELDAVPKIVEKYDAINLLYQRFLQIDSDRDRLVLLSSDAKGMTCGIDYAAVLAICFICSIMCLYEKKIKPVHITSQSTKKAAGYRLLSIAIAIIMMWALTNIVQLMSVIKVIGAENLSYGVASLSDFKYTPFDSLSIFQIYILLEITRLIGYLFIAAVTLLLCMAVNNFVVSCLLPFAATAVWIYLFGTYAPAYYSPFSLVLGYPYFTGKYEIIAGNLTIVLYEELPVSLYAVLVIINIIVTVTAAVIYLSKYSQKKMKTKKAPLISALAISVMLILSGCTDSRVAEENVTVSSHSIAWNEDKTLCCKTSNTTDDEGNVISSITLYDENENVIEQDILRQEPIDYGKWINSPLISDGYVYYVLNEGIGSSIARISLTDYGKEMVYKLPDYENYRKYFDLLTVYGSTNHDDIFILSGLCKRGNELYVVFGNHKLYTINVNTKSMKYILEDIVISDICVDRLGRIYYINSSGNAILYDGEKRILSEHKFYLIYIEDGYLYCENKSDRYRFSLDEFKEEYVGKVE